jgi:hypothetical protein
MRVAFGMLALLAGTAPALAQDNPACAKYENPLAYNACLAKLGPKAGATRAESAPGYDGPAAVRRTHGLVTITRNRRGRVEAVFSVRPRT